MHTTDTLKTCDHIIDIEINRGLAQPIVRLRISAHDAMTVAELATGARELCAILDWLRSHLDNPKNS